jgi:hypothetical protein
MKTGKSFFAKKILSVCIVFLLSLTSNYVLAVSNQLFPGNDETENYFEYKGLIVDRKTGDPLAFANISVVNTNITIVSNTEGQFSIKLPKGLSPKVSVSFIGYKNKQVLLTDLNTDKPRIELESSVVQLPELSVSAKDAAELIKAVLEKKGENYFDSQTLMTAFYRETIKKNKSYASLSEAVVEINKQPYTSFKTDVVRLFKSRKKADYAKLDTLTFKLMGGPFNSLYLDVMKYPEVLFTQDMMANYEFTFDQTSHIDRQMIYVIDFKQRTDKTEPLYYGKLYIDAQTLALKSAVFSLNITDKEEASKMFIMKKPLNARVFPTEAKYRIDYREKDGRWYYGYSRIELGLKIIWKKKLFNTTYNSTVEMAVTDWGKNAEKKSVEFKDRLKPTVIISDETSGFNDPQFWGEFNVIEPEKSIEAAIRKIQKQLEKK